MPTVSCRLHCITVRLCVYVCVCVHVCVLVTNGGSCQSTWLVRNGINSIGAQQLTAMSISDCLNVCASNSLCVAADINIGVPTLAIPICWLHLNVVDLVYRFSTAGVNQYLLVTRCPVATPPAKGRRTPPPPPRVHFCGVPCMGSSRILVFRLRSVDLCVTASACRLAQLLEYFLAVIRVNNPDHSHSILSPHRIQPNPLMGN